MRRFLRWPVTYVMPIIYVPARMITHFVAFYILGCPQPTTTAASDAIAF
jgi:hypothetical protein